MMISEETLKQLREALSSYMSPPRREHSLSVEKECAVIGKVCRMTEEEISMLRVSALLHDLTRELPLEKQLALFEKSNTPLPADGILSTAVLHQFTSPMVISSDFPAFDLPEITQPIASHTTGKKEMSLPAKILFLADIIEPKRLHRFCRETRKKFYEHLGEENLIDSTLLACLGDTITHLIVKGDRVSVQTLEAYNYYSLRKDKEKN